MKTYLQAVAIRLSLHKTIFLCPVYIPKNYKLQPRELTELFQQLPAPFMIMGDFNVHNPLLGSDKVTDKGKIVEDVLSNLNLCILNDGSNTYLRPCNGSFSSIDLTIVDPSLLLDLHRSVHDDFCDVIISRSLLKGMIL